jgi:hypothetical protein
VRRGTSVAIALLLAAILVAALIQFVLLPR